MTPLVAYLLLFVAVGIGFIFVHLVVGKLIRPAKPSAEKQTIYECGEPTIGSAWIQFDLRFYVVALLFVIFDVEVAFFFPWAEVFGTANAIRLTETEPTQTGSKPTDAALASYQRNVLALVPPHRHGTAKKLFALERPAQGNLERAASLAWLALIDILVFFGVLLVGFAYLWKRGDLAWVRSVTNREPASVPPLTTGSAVATSGVGS